MKHLLPSALLLAGLAGCTPDAQGPEQAAKYPARLTIPTGARDQARPPASTSKTDTVDHFFFTDAHYRRVAALNQLDMLRLDDAGTLDICGRDVEKLRYKASETITDFLTHNLTGTDSLPLGKVRVVAWSSDLSGNDERFFFFKAGRLRHVREQSAPDLAQLRESWH